MISTSNQNVGQNFDDFKFQFQLVHTLECVNCWNIAPVLLLTFLNFESQL